MGDTAFCGGGGGGSGGGGGGRLVVVAVVVVVVAVVVVVVVDYATSRFLKICFPFFRKSQRHASSNY